jgi:alkylation response protein AidB-like acyl-CoA dehydrogenase
MMTQPDNFGFGEEAALLKASARKFFSDRFPASALHALVAADHRPERASECLWDRDLWQQAVDLGWNLLAVPEEAGGIGMPAVAVAGLAEEFGRAALPCPLLGTLSASAVLSGCNTAAAGAALAEIVEGRSATLAVTNRAGSWSPMDSGVTVAGGRLNGSAWYVQDARKSDRLLVSARGDSGIQLYWVAADAPGVTLHADTIVDLSRDQAHIGFEDAAGELLCDDGATVLAGAMPFIWTCLAADMVGAAEWQLQTTVEYVNTRQQFDHPLGFFQAVKHQLVDVMLQIDQAKSLVYNAACALDTEPERAAECAHMAKAAASEAAAFASGRSVQLHGGIGFTWECQVHLFFKRQKHSQMLYGDAAWHRARLADIVIGPAAQAGSAG